MGNVKRVLIFSPNFNTQKELEKLVLKSFSPDFALYRNEVLIQKFENIHQSYTLKSQIGLGGEILALFDTVLLENSPNGTERKNLKALLTAEKRNCEDKKIPYLDCYKNQIWRREILDDLRRQFYPRLEADDLFKYQ
jgi:hypothetical protein